MNWSRPEWLTDERIVRAYNAGNPPLSARDDRGALLEVGVHSSCWVPIGEVFAAVVRQPGHHDPGDEDRS